MHSNGRFDGSVIVHMEAFSIDHRKLRIMQMDVFNKGWYPCIHLLSISVSKESGTNIDVYDGLERIGEMWTSDARQTTWCRQQKQTWVNSCTVQRIDTTNFGLAMEGTLLHVLILSQCDIMTSLFLAPLACHESQLKEKGDEKIK